MLPGPVLKGLYWFLVATIAEVLPAVCGYFHVQILPLIASMSQVFICLNLNSKFRIYLVCQWMNAYRLYSK